MAVRQKENLSATLPRAWTKRGFKRKKTNFSQSGSPDGELAEGIARAVENNTCNALAPPNLYLATKNLVEADGSLILVYILAILGI